MARMNRPSEDASFFNIGHAKWVVGVLTMLIAVVGKESLVGLMLRQTRSEIDDFVRAEEPDPSTAKAACYRNN